ncbi:MAG: DNA-binding protein [Alphaproteobacteria bacterium]|nr:DNA-binding protein [Alphaproteobacteria bacterium]
MRNRTLFLTSRQLAKRWNINAATLRQWRWFKKGPQFQKVEGNIRYKLEVIERFENELIRAHTTEDQKTPTESISELVSEENKTE